MPVADKITSFQNPRVKEVVKMHRSRVRKEKGLIIVEGLREILMAKEAGFKIEYLMICPVLFHDSSVAAIQKLVEEHTCFEVSAKVFAKMAYRDQSDGLLAVMQAVIKSPDDLKLSSNPLLIVLESVEKPGNLGAILRTADAAGVDAVIICDPLTDIYNPNVIRSSIGCVFVKQVAVCTSEAALRWLRKNNIEPVAASLTAKKYHFESNFRTPLAFVFGAEAEGLSDLWLNNTTTQAKIPMTGKIDSLNVSNSVAILVYEAMRQREFIK